MKKNTTSLLSVGTGLLGIYCILKIIAKRYTETEDIDIDNPYIKGRKINSKPETIYERNVKPILDQVLSFGGLVVLAPLYGLISFAIYVDDMGPIFFTQKRVGKDKHFFMLHKYRTMKMNTPHDVPTHMLEHPERYITHIGKLLRKTSLDELPQIWDIFRGKMSIIGPRPALWNQEDLVTEREKVGANILMPGLTGLAQIKGRDELLISEKAEIDGEYAKKIQKGGVAAFKQDAVCFLGTVWSVLHHDGVIEGGTGNLPMPIGNTQIMGNSGGKSRKSSVNRFEDYGFNKTFHIDNTVHKRVLITGAESYVGESFEKYAAEYYPNIEVHTVDMTDESWRLHDFSRYDCVFHVAGIAHADVEKVTEEEKKHYYAVNTNLAIETAAFAKASGVSQFIFMSSMIVYGNSTSVGVKRVINEYTEPVPANFYGDSKWQADKGVRELADDMFRVAVLRPPMIYGKGSKGNYSTLSRISRKVPLIPNIENCRSMLHIDNLCEFICLLILSSEGGIYFPQNAEYTKTAEMIRAISKEYSKKVALVKVLNPLVLAASHVPGKIGVVTNKAFGNSIYSQDISRYEGLEYQKVGLKESIHRTESNRKKSVLILVNHDVVIYNFRLELVERLLDDGYEVHISSPYGERIVDLISLGAVYHEINIERHGMNPMKDMTIFRSYHQLIKEIHPIVILGYTIKPNIYGAMTARLAHIPFIANITGLGTAVENGGMKQNITVLLYKAAFGKVKRVFFQNEENEHFFKDAGIAVNRHALLPGSGVNLNRYIPTMLPECGDGKKGGPVKFAFISRIMKEKGIDQYLSAAKKIKKEYPNTEFHVCGFCEKEYEGRLEELNISGVVQYHGMIRDVSEFMGEIHCIVHPTYYPEGMSNVLLEACACGRAIITTNRSGCREVVNGKNGYLIKEKNEDELVEALKKFMILPQKEKVAMGMNGRRLVEQKFSRDIIVNAYMKEINEIDLDN